MAEISKISRLLRTVPSAGSLRTAIRVMSWPVSILRAVINTIKWSHNSLEG